MKIFISWSGEKSKSVALRLREWLPDVLQTISPWMSSTDIEAGVRWNPEINTQLSQTSFGIICLTADNLSAPWLHFEAGALAKSIEQSRVCPYLIGIGPSNIPSGPLAQFQSKRANKEETLQLLESLNVALDNNALSNDSFKRTFNRSWPDLDEVIKSATQKAPIAGSAQRDERDLLDEILERVRATSIPMGTISKISTNELFNQSLKRIEQQLARLITYSELAASHQSAVIYSTARAMWEATEGVMEEIVMELQHTEGDCAKDCLAKIRKIESALLTFLDRPYTGDDLRVVP